MKLRCSQFAKTVLILFLLFVSSYSFSASLPKKRQFRGAWIQCVNGQFQNLGSEQMQRTLIYQLDKLQQVGVNAIIFQIRAECDALYPSKYEPWSKFLTGKQGSAPSH